MGRTRQYPSGSDGAPLLHVRLHPDVLQWVREVKGYGWARAYIEAAYAAETGREVPFPNRTRPERNKPQAEPAEGQ